MDLTSFSSAYYLSNPFESITNGSSVTFSFYFRIDDFDARFLPTAFIGLMTDQHVENFGDGLTLVLSTSEGRLVGNANVDQGDFRSAADTTLILEKSVPYLAVGRLEKGT